MQGTNNSGTTRTAAPTLMIGLGVTSKVSEGKNTPRAFQFESDEAAICYSYRDHGKWSKTINLKLDSPCDLFRVLKSLDFDKCRPYIIAPRGHDALTLCGFWSKIESGELTVRKPISPKAKNQTPRFYPLIMSGRPDIIGWHDGARSYRCISIDNHVEINLSGAANSVGLCSSVPLGSPGSLELPHWKAELQALVCLKWYQYIADWWIKNGCGQWADSVGAAAWNTFRAKGVPSVLRDHNAPAFVELESTACYGGRCGAWFAGPIGHEDQWAELDTPPRYPVDCPGIIEPVTRYDIKSMYPTILRDELFPTKLIHSTFNCKLHNLEAMLIGGLCIAGVRIKSLRAETPRRRLDGKTISTQYPVGVFDTVLATPELRTALQRGEIEKIYVVAQYSPGRPFRAWADFVLNARTVQRRDGNAAGQALCKALANSLSGRLAARRKGWQITDKQRAPAPWGEFSKIRLGEAEASKFRALGGIVQEWTETEIRGGLLAACYAHLTAYGRTRMAMTREMLGADSTVWQDTDGIMVRASSAGRMDLTGGLDSGAFGTFRTEDRVDCALFYGAKAYWIDGTWIVSGLRDSYTVRDGLEIEEQFVKNPARSAVSPGKGQLLAVKRTVDLAALKMKEQYNRNGWLLPPHSMMDERSAPDGAGVPFQFIT